MIFVDNTPKVTVEVNEVTGYDLKTQIITESIIWLDVEEWEKIAEIRRKHREDALYYIEIARNCGIVFINSNTEIK